MWTYRAYFSIGKRIGYSDRFYEKNELLDKIYEYQRDNDLNLSIEISETIIVCNKQKESHFKLSFLKSSNMKRFTFKNKIKDLCNYLMVEFQQNRIIIEFPITSHIIEQSKQIDHRIEKIRFHIFGEQKQKTPIFIL